MIAGGGRWDSGPGKPARWTGYLQSAYAPWPTIRDVRGHLRVDVHTGSVVIHYVRAETDETNGEIVATDEIVPPPEG